MVRAIAEAADGASKPLSDNHCGDLANLAGPTWTIDSRDQGTGEGSAI
jgi:hypothetical protein